MEVAPEVVTQIERLLDAMGVELVEASIEGPRRRRTLRLTIYRPEGVDLDLCTDVSELVSNLLDELDPIEGSYVLEVSSPGLERPLKKPRDFERAVGETVRIKKIDGTVAQGLLETAGPEGGTLDTGEEKLAFSYGELKSARTVFEWDGR